MVDPDILIGRQPEKVFWCYGPQMEACRAPKNFGPSHLKGEMGTQATQTPPLDPL